LPHRKPVGQRPLARSFGAVATTYDRVRPPYFQPLLDRAQQALHLAPEATVLDLGAGTGRLTRELARRFARVFAVEPDDDMRALIGVGEILSGTAEQIPLADDAVDAVFVSEAFHWFDTAAALVELVRVLRSRGGLAIISTHWWETEPPLPDGVQALFREPFDRSLAERPPPWDNAFVGSPFEPLARERYEEAMTVDADLLLAMYSTTSALAVLPDEERDALFATVRPQLAGPYRLPIKHTLAWTRLRTEPRSRTRGSAASPPD
jgi:SAM-dependent methyltransferase